LKKGVLLLSALLVAGGIAGLVALLLPAAASEKSFSPITASDAVSVSSDGGGPLEYSAKFICGSVSEADYEELGHLVPGTYLTAVNVHNPSLTEPVTLLKKVAVALPDEVVGPIVIISDGFTVGPDYAFEVDCQEIFDALKAAGYTYTSAKGFVVITSPLGPDGEPALPLDVTAVYTLQNVSAVAGSEGLGLAIDVEPVPAFTVPSAPDPTAPSNVYSAKFVCGPSAGPDPVVTGDYATGINVHNPNIYDVYLTKKVVLAYAEGEDFGPISAFQYEYLPPDGAWEIDCSDIRGFFPPGQPLPAFIKGFVVIETMDDPTGLGMNGELDVVPVYTVRRVTAAPNNGYGNDIDVLRVAKEAKTAPPPPTATATATPTNTPTPTATPMKTSTPTATNTPVPTATPTVVKPELTEYFYCRHSVTPSGANTRVHVGCAMVQQPPPQIFDWEVIYADQTPVMVGPALESWICSEDNATDWVPDTSLIATRVKCEDPTHGTRPWLAGQCRDIDFTLPGAQGPWSTLKLHATDQDQNNVGIFFSSLGQPPC
jgi:hypothetical protein